MSFRADGPVNLSPHGTGSVEHVHGKAGADGPC